MFCDSIFRLIVSGLILYLLSSFRAWDTPSGGIFFRFKAQDYALTHTMQLDALAFRQRPQCNNRCLDTLSNRFLVDKQYVEIIRQDASAQPHWGIALGFEFDESNGEYPYTPANAVIQLKDFGWGGVEFSRRDTSNYTGVSNNISNDISVEIDSFINDTVYGRFSGLLLSGAGPMAVVDSGEFKVRLYRVRD
jgi:hypothetical protein